MQALLAFLQAVHFLTPALPLGLFCDPLRGLIVLFDIAGWIRGIGRAGFELTVNNGCGLSKGDRGV
jgi:hypothetical protein